jgi:sulfatase modifying factor 1
MSAGIRHGNYTLALSCLIGCNAAPDGTNPCPTEPLPKGAPSCAGPTALCGIDANDSCCSSPVVTGGRYARSFDVAHDDYSQTATFPAVVSTFRLDKYETTVGRFRQFVHAGMGTQRNAPLAGGGAHEKIPGSGWDPQWDSHLLADSDSLVAALTCDPALATWTYEPRSNDDRPINCVTWFEAMAFCTWDQGYLPTEAEWNYAATGGDQQRAYPWSRPAGSLLLDADHASYWDQNTEACVISGEQDCSIADILLVGTKPAGDARWGQSDLAGNVFEWTLDWGAPYGDTCTDCANLSPGAHRELRGGSFASDTFDLRSGRRLALDPAVRIPMLGFRCARPVE